MYPGQYRRLGLAVQHEAPRGTPREDRPDVDWTPFLQAAIDFIINPPLVGRIRGRVPLTRQNLGTLYFPPGLYRITRPLIIARREGGRFLPCSISLVGEANSLDAFFHGSCICTDYGRTELMRRVRNADWPAIIIQAGHSVRLSRLVIRGDNHFRYPNFRFDGSPLESRNEAFLLGQELFGADPYLLDGVRNNPASPHAGICIDPFHPGVTDEPDRRDRYPGLEGFYLPGPPSHDIVLDDCRILDFAVGICVAPSGLDMESQDERPDQLSLTVVNGKLFQNKSGVSVSGPRRVMLHSAGIGDNEICINCTDYGGRPRRPGLCPSIFGGNLGAKYLFKTGNTGGHASINGVFVESTLSLGQLGAPVQTPADAVDRYTFNGCSFTFFNGHNRLTQERSPVPLPTINAHLINFAHTTFNGCTFIAAPTTDKTLPSVPIHFINGSQQRGGLLEHPGEAVLSFVGCNLGGAKNRGAPEDKPADPDLGPEFWVSGRTERVSYTNCMVRDILFNAMGNKNPQPTLFSDIQAVDSLHNTLNVPYLMTQTVPGTLYHSFNTLSQNELADEKTYGPFLRWVAGGLPRIPVWIDATRPRMPMANFKINTRTEMVRGRMVQVPDGTATLEGVEAGTLQRGDVITAVEAFQGVLLHDPTPGSKHKAPLLLGRVAEVKEVGGKEIATLIFVPIGLRDGLKEERELVLAYFPRIHPPTTGAVVRTAGAKNIIDNVRTRPRFKKDPMDMIDFPYVAQQLSWGTGHRIFGKGISAGAFIKKIEFRESVMKITISKDFLDDIRETALYDADLRGVELLTI